MNWNWQSGKGDERLIASWREVLDLREGGQLFWKPGPPRVGRGGSSRYGKRAGAKKAEGYRIVKVGDSFVYEHRIVFALAHGFLPIEVDHINGVKDDNRPENLRAATTAENNRNKPAPRNNKSGFKGVHQCARSGRWLAEIKAGDLKQRLGRYATKEEAAAAYAQAAALIHGKFARTS